MGNNYLFIDGSALLSDIKKYRDSHQVLKDKQFDPVIFSNYFFRSHRFDGFHSGSYRRVVFYFVENDERVKEYIKLPDFDKSGLIEDLQIKYCGKKLTNRKSATEWLENNKAPETVYEFFHKSEKAVDTQICCDALLLLSLNKLNRLFLYTNDYDFIPLCRTIKTMGENVNLVKLEETRVNKDLVSECDSFHTFKDHEIFNFFGQTFQTPTQQQIDTQPK